MQVTPLLKRINKDFISQYLKALGIKDVKKYLKPDNSCFDNPFDYKNMDEAINLLSTYRTINKEKIGILIDSDCDGACSAALMTLFLREIGITDIKYFYHEGKQHGLHTKVDEILQSNINLLIVPDAGSNDIEECKTLKQNHIDILILDHHMIEKPNNYAILVNPFLGENLNTSISGTGVVYKFIEAYRIKNNIKCSETYLYNDIVAVSLISDVCDLTTLENRAFIEFGLNYPTNPFISYLFEKCCKYRGVNPEGITWEISPLANALARVDDQENKLLFFKALIGDIDYETALKEIRKVKRVQDNAVKSVVEEIEPTLDLSHKAIIGFSESENKSYLGLIANKFCGKYNKPTILLRELNSTTWTGSLRSPIPLAQKINNSGLAKAQGHEEACGIFIHKANLEKFKQWCDNLNLSNRPAIPVTACVSPEELNTDLCKQIQKWKILWGKKCESPSFYLDLVLTKDNLAIYEKSTTTIKLFINGLSCLLFFAKLEDIEAFTKYNTFEIKMIVNGCGINEWEGNSYPQCNIIDYEISPFEEYNNDWSELF